MIDRLILNNIPPFYTSTLEFSKINIIYGESTHLLRLLYHVRKFISSPYSEGNLHNHISYLIDGSDYQIDVYYEDKLLTSTFDQTQYKQSVSLKPVYLPYIGLIQLHRLLTTNDLDVETIYKDMVSLMNGQSISLKIDGRLLATQSAILTKLCTLLKGHGHFTKRNGFYFKRNERTIPTHWMTPVENVLASLEWVMQKGGLLNEGCLFWEAVNIREVELLYELIDLISYRNQVFLTTTNPLIMNELITRIPNENIRVFNEGDFLQ